MDPIEHVSHFMPPDIAIEIFQKSAPSPIRKLQKKYAAHVSRFVRRIVYTCKDHKCFEGTKSGPASLATMVFRLFLLSPQGGMHLSVRHDARSGLHRKAPT